MATKLRKGQIYEIVKTGYRLKIVKIGKLPSLKGKLATMYFTNNKSHGRGQFSIEENSFKLFGKTKLIK